MADAAPTPEARLDAALDPARLPHRAAADRDARLMPWQRPGVVATDAKRDSFVAAPMSRKALATLLASLSLPILAIIIISWAFGHAASGALPLATILVLMAPIVAGGIWLPRRAHRTGQVYAGAWAWLAFLAWVLLVTIAAALFPPLASLGPTILPCMVLPSWFTLLLPLAKRTGQTLHCARCDYLYEYTDPSGPHAPDSCSECGALWHDRRGLFRGSKVRVPAWRLIVFGLLLATTFVIIANPGPLRSVTPTTLLISRVTTPRAGFTTSEWAELNTRSLSDAQRLRLARGLLTLRLSDQFLPREADIWLDQEITAGRLPADLADRYHSELFDATIHVPQPCRVGVPATIGLETVSRGYPSGPREAQIALLGFSTDAAPETLIATSDRLLYSSLIGIRSRAWGRVSMSNHATTATLTFDTPGLHRVRCIYWLVAVPRNTPPATITWNDDGTPNLPPGVHFSQRREIFLDIQVSP